MPERNFEQNLSPEDAGHMDALVPKIREILADAEGMENLSDEARHILQEAAKNTEDNNLVAADENLKELVSGDAEFDNEDLQQQIEDTRKKMEEERKNDDPTFFGNLEKGTVEEIFFKVLMEEVPDSGVTINPQARTRDNVPQPNIAAVEIAPYKTDEEFISETLKHPILKVLLFPDMPSTVRIQKDLEQQGLLSTDIFKKALRRQCDWGIKTGDAEYWQDVIKDEKLDKVEPLSDDEAEDIVRQVIRDEYKKKLGL